MVNFNQQMHPKGKSAHTVNVLQIDWLNSYHMECRNKVGELLQQQGHQEAYNWLVRETQPIG